MTPDLLGQSPVLSVGITSADLMNLDGAARALAKSGVRVAHFDVMDGHFAPQLTAGPFFVKGFRTPLLKDVHLMIEEPLGSLDDYVAAGADIVTIHVESCRHVHRVLQRLRELPNANDRDRGILRGLALNPSTPVSAIEPFLDEVDLVLIVAVNPGFSKQAFLPRAIDRFGAVRERVRSLGRRVLVGIDGGVTRNTIAAIAAARPDLVVSGSAVFEGGIDAVAENVAALDRSLHP